MKTSVFSSVNGDIRTEQAFVNNLHAAAAPTSSADSSLGYEVGSVWIYNGAIYTCTDNTAGAAVWAQQQNALTNTVAGVGASYKVARGVHQIAAAQDTVATGLTTVVAVIAQFQDAPTINVLFIAASIGDQAGAPVAGSFLLNSYKPTATGNVTPAAATVFTDNIHVNWIALGT